MKQLIFIDNELERGARDDYETAQTQLEITVDTYLNSDPTLRLFSCRDGILRGYDYKLLDWHITLHKAAFLIALQRYLDHKYPTDKI